MSTAGVRPTTDVLATIGRLRVIPVVVLEKAAAARPLGDALRKGGLPIVEVTLRTPVGMQALAELADQSSILVGAGTVVTAGQALEAISLGARFVLSPGLDLDVVATCQDAGVTVIPGVSTATDLMTAVKHGVRVVKFFPAEAAGGPAAISALSGPFPDVRFIPTGGITAASMAGYLRHPAVLAVGGSWMVAPDLLAGGRWADVGRLAAQAVALAGAP